MLYAIACLIGPCHNKTWLYHTIVLEYIACLCHYNKACVISISFNISPCNIFFCSYLCDSDSFITDIQQFIWAVIYQSPLIKWIAEVCHKVSCNFNFICEQWWGEYIAYGHETQTNVAILLTWINFNPCINHIHYKVGDEIINPFLNIWGKNIVGQNFLNRCHLLISTIFCYLTLRRDSCFASICLFWSWWSKSSIKSQVMTSG